MGIFGSSGKKADEGLIFVFGSFSDTGGGGGRKGKAKGKPPAKGEVKVGGKVRTPRGMTPNMKGMGGAKTAGQWKRAGETRSGETVWKRVK